MKEKIEASHNPIESCQTPEEKNDAEISWNSMCEIAIQNPFNNDAQMRRKTCIDNTFIIPPTLLVIFIEK